ncbi:MAG: hypothetical protein K6G85_01645 [Eubacterium sp.]|nr:hypothetical protein [Eubacterium sp.]
MKDYRVEAKAYNEAGTLTNEKIKREFEHPLDAVRCYKEWKELRQGPPNNYKQYGEVKFIVMAEKEITDVDSFEALFKA